MEKLCKDSKDGSHETAEDGECCIYCGARLKSLSPVSKKYIALQFLTCLFVLVILFIIMTILFVWAFDHR